MSLKNCPECGGLFVHVQGTPLLCPNCLRKQEDQFTLVRDYLREHPGAGLAEVAEATGVTSEAVLQFMRQGRLISSGELGFSLHCERCGQPIKEGRYCPSCAAEMKGQLATASRELRRTVEPRAERPRSGERMYTATLRRKDEN